MMEIHLIGYLIQLYHLSHQIINEIISFMCGISGIISLNGRPIPHAEKRINRMNELLKHRGPDAQGYFISKAVDELWQQHLSGKFNRTHELWNIFMFQAWLSNNQLDN